MDRLENESFHASIFKNLNQKFWYKRISWNYAKKVFGYKIDGWHLCKSAMIISMCLTIVFYTPIFGIFDVILFGILWNLIFNLFYSNLYVKH